jgi:hypothetical protein
LNPARRRRSAVERLATPLIAVALCLGMATEARAAYAGSDIWYNSANGKLSGYTLTALEWWETLPGQFYSEGCECWVQYVDSVRVDGALFDLDNQIHLAVPPYYHPYEAVVVLDEWSPPRVGNWTAWGNHFVVRDYYVNYQWVHRDIFGIGATSKSAHPRAWCQPVKSRCRRTGIRFRPSRRHMTSEHGWCRAIPLSALPARR